MGINFLDEFFKTLRRIQKKERNNSSLARVDDTFYKDIRKYIKDLKEDIGTDIFADNQYLLKDVQMVATEICERREHKITEAALMNMHRSYHLFNKNNPQFDIVDTTPLNLTEEEETLYFSLLDSFKNHRNKISLDKFSDELKTEDIESININNENISEDNNVSSINDNYDVDNYNSNLNKSKDFKNDDEVLNHLDKIKNAKVITDQKYEPIEKQLQKNKTENISSKINEINEENVLDNIYKDNENQFINIDDINKKDDFENIPILVFKEIGPIMGVDEKVYGPFNPQDIVVMPRINAEILLKYNMARLIKI